jgi:hypothetical protein
VEDNTTLGSSNTDTINFVGRINSDFDPATDNTYDLGRTGHEWRDLYIDGTANIDSLIADTADINAGTIDNTSIGASTASTGAFTTLSATGVTTVQAGTVSAPAITTTGDTNTGIYFPAADVVGLSTGGTERMRVDASGNVGIGTSTPSAKLQVADSGDTSIKVTKTAVSSVTVEAASTTCNISWDGSTNLAFLGGSSGTVERARIDSDGNLLVGTTTVGGGNWGISICPNLVNGTGRIIFDRTSTAASAIAIEFENADATVGSITYTNTATTYNTSSDYRLKHDIQPMTGALDKVAQLQPVTYKWNADDS